MQTDCASTSIKRPADDVFRFLTDPANMDLWSFGTWKTVIADDGLIKGQALQDGSSVYVRIESHADQLLIDYHVGSDANRLQPDNESILTMLAIRTPEMSDERWQSLINAHAVEIELIRSLIETGYDHRV